MEQGSQVSHDKKLTGPVIQQILGPVSLGARIPGTGPTVRKPGNHPRIPGTGPILVGSAKGETPN